MHLGVQLLPQHTEWEALRRAALQVDQLDLDSLWAWDHMVPVGGRLDGGVFEGWQIVAAWGAITRRVPVGVLVSCNSFRHPALLAKMATTLDHVTGGRALVGLGAGWFAAEHTMYGLPLGPIEARMQRFDEAAYVVRTLLREKSVSYRGAHYHLSEAVCEPKPAQRALPLLIGGGGERWTLRVAAKYADIWHWFGSPEVMSHKIQVLKRRCDEVGRDFASITPAVGGEILIAASDERLEQKLRAIERTTATPRTDFHPMVLGTVDDFANLLSEYWRVGIRAFMFGLHPPFDEETIELLATEVRARALERIGP